MGDHLVNGEFQSDKYPTTPRGKVPLSCKDPTAQDLLWEYAQRRRSVDEQFSDDLETALRAAGFDPGGGDPMGIGALTSALYHIPTKTEDEAHAIVVACDLLMAYRRARCGETPK